MVKLATNFTTDPHSVQYEITKKTTNLQTESTKKNNKLNDI